MITKDSEKSRVNWNLGQELIRKYLSGEVKGSDQISIALQACKTHGAMVATESSQVGNLLVATRMISENVKEREAYVKKSMPQLVVK